jgi:lipopolysaccharide exporter
LPQISENKRQIFSSLQWTYLSFAVSGILQMVMLAVMARLISPIEFGILASALVTIRAGHTLVQSGYERAVIWSENQSASIHAGLFWVAVATGLSLTFIFLLLAWPVAAFFRNDNIAYVLFALSPMPTLASFGLIARGILRRAMNYRLLAIQETASYALGYGVVGLTFALLHFGVWSLVLANLALSALQGLIPMLFVRHKIFTPFKLQDIITPLKFGYSVSGLGLIEFVDLQVPQVFVGRFYGVAPLGIYNRAYSLVELPLVQLGTALSKVLYSSFSLAKDRHDELEAILLPPLRALALIVFPLAAGGAAVAHPLVAVVLGSGWDSVAPVFATLAIGTACAVVANVLVVFNEALNQVRIKMVLQTITTSCLIIGLVLTANWGLVVAAIAVSVSRVVFLAGQILIAARAIKIDPIIIAKALLPGVMIAALIFATLKMIEYSPQWQQAPVLAQSIFAVFVSLTLLIGSTVLFLPRERRLLLSGLRQKLKTVP